MLQAHKAFSILHSCKTYFRVWRRYLGPIHHVLIDQLESIQRRAVRFIMNDYSRYSSVTGVMSELGIEPLILRRKIGRLNTFQKVGGTLQSQLKNCCTRSNGFHAISLPEPTKTVI